MGLRGCYAAYLLRGACSLGGCDVYPVFLGCTWALELSLASLAWSLNVQPVHRGISPSLTVVMSVRWSSLPEDSTRRDSPPELGILGFVCRWIFYLPWQL